MLKRLKNLITQRGVNYDGVRRNDECPCGSGHKFKQCCIDRVEKKTRAVRDAKIFGGRKG
jgi:uncharacterized protein YchJ